MRRALVLRAREDARRTEKKLADIGFACVLSPALEIVATGAKAPAGDFDAVIVTSAKALEHGDQTASLRRLPLFVVGARTAALAERLGWRIAGRAPESAALLSVILGDRTSPRRLLYLAGRQRRDKLEAQLRWAGCEVFTLEAYEAREATALTREAAKALASGELSAALHYSPRSAAIFARLVFRENLSTAASALAHFVISAETGAALAPLGMLTKRVAASPDEDALLAALAAFDWTQESQI
ncbi:MAG: uroporphyrinogen-III synthase [Methylocystis sp.]